MTKTTWADVGGGLTEKKEHTRSSTSHRFGRTSFNVTCPFCGSMVTAYLWSLSGGGKRCPGCGGLHDALGFTHKLREVFGVNSDPGG